MKRWCNIIGIDFRDVVIEVVDRVKYAGSTEFLPDGKFKLKLNELLLKNRNVVRMVVIHELVHMKLRSPQHDDAFFKTLFRYISEEEYWALYRRMEKMFMDFFGRKRR